MAAPVIVITEPVIIAFIGACLSLATAIISAIVAVLTVHMRGVVRQTHQSMAVLEKHTNSIKDALVETTAKASHAEGKLEGKEEARQDQRRQLIEAGRIDPGNSPTPRI